jgi:hypothetical protein
VGRQAGGRAGRPAREEEPVGTATSFGLVFLLVLDVALLFSRLGSCSPAGWGGEGREREREREREEDEDQKRAEAASSDRLTVLSRNLLRPSFRPSSSSWSLSSCGTHQGSGRGAGSRQGRVQARHWVSRHVLGVAAGSGFQVPFPFRFFRRLAH